METIKYTRKDDCMDNENFIVDTKSKADWCMENIKKAREALEQNEKTAKEIMERKEAEVNEWLKKENKQYENTIDTMMAFLRPWVDFELEKENENKKKPKSSITLPSGKVGYKKKADEFTYKGVKCDSKNDNLIEIVGTEYIEVKQVLIPKWSDFKKIIDIVDGKAVNTETGEVLPIEVKIGEYEFYCK